MKFGFRRILREIIVCSLLAACVLFVMIAADPTYRSFSEMLAILAASPLYGVPVWGVYRLGRFIFAR